MNFSIPLPFYFLRCVCSPKILYFTMLFSLNLSSCIIFGLNSILDVLISLSAASELLGFKSIVERDIRLGTIEATYIRHYNDT